MGGHKRRAQVAEDDTGGIDLWNWDTGKAKLLPVHPFTTTATYGFYDDGDGFDVGDVLGTGKGQIVIAEDNDGGVDVWGLDAAGELKPLKSFLTKGGAYGWYDGGDAFAVGDVLGDSKAEIIVAEDDSGGVDVWGLATDCAVTVSQSFPTTTGDYGWYDGGDGFALGDVLGAGRQQIIIAEDDTGGVDVYGLEPLANWGTSAPSRPKPASMVGTIAVTPSRPATCGAMRKTKSS